MLSNDMSHAQCLMLPLLTPICDHIDPWGHMTCDLLDESFRLRCSNVHFDKVENF